MRRIQPTVAGFEGVGRRAGSLRWKRKGKQLSLALPERNATLPTS